MISHEMRCRYDRNQLAEVICQLRFPEILTIETSIPAAFQEAIRRDFPQYAARKEQNAPVGPGAPAAGNMNYQFVSKDNHFRVNLTSKFISLACNRYTCWEDFAAQLDKPLAAFIRIYKPAYFERIGLRYVNFISRKALSLEVTPFRKLISPAYLGILQEEDVAEQATVRATVDADTALRGGCRVKLHAGPGMVRRGPQQDPEAKFILDLDLYMPGKVEVPHSAGALQTLHAQAFPVFRGAITDTLHEAMEPQLI